MPEAKNRILWVDCIGGLVVGCLVLLLHRLLSEWEKLPLWLILAMGTANLVYGSFSLYTTTRNPRPLKLVQTLAIANMVWLGICVAIIAVYWQRISLVGFSLVLLEGIYVGSLGYWEWNWQQMLAAKTNTTTN